MTDLATQIEALPFLTADQKQYFLLKLDDLTEEGIIEIGLYLERANQRYLEEEKRIEQRYAEELHNINKEVDRDFIAAKKLIESSMLKQDEIEQEIILNQL